MGAKDDHAFLRQFSAVIVGFMVLTVVLIFLARYLQPDPDPDANPSQAILNEQRILPVGAVLSGEAGAEALAQAQAVAAAPVVRTEPVVDGEAVYGGLCKTCHDAGVAGSPITGSDQMAARLEEKGLEMLVSNAINGLNAMPPRGGNPNLTDEQIQAAVEFMLP